MIRGSLRPTLHVESRPMTERALIRTSLSERPSCGFRHRRLNTEHARLAVLDRNASGRLSLREARLDIFRFSAESIPLRIGFGLVLANQ
jgi:hypothetical protein